MSIHVLSHPKKIQRDTWMNKTLHRQEIADLLRVQSRCRTESPSRGDPTLPPSLRGRRLFPVAAYQRVDQCPGGISTCPDNAGRVLATAEPRRGRPRQTSRGWHERLQAIRSTADRTGAQHIPAISCSQKSMPPTLPLSVRTTWFRILDERIQRGEIKSISPVGFAVYAVIKEFQPDRYRHSLRQPRNHRPANWPQPIYRDPARFRRGMKHQWIRDADANSRQSPWQDKAICRDQTPSSSCGRHREVVGEVVWTNIPQTPAHDERAR